MPDTSSRFTEVAPRVWVAHYDWMHVNITLIGGSDGLVMVDTHGSADAARIVADDVRRLGAGPLTAMVNTHEHWDHYFGNATMLEEFGDLPIHATEFALDHIEASAARTFDALRAGDRAPAARRDPRHHAATGRPTTSPRPSRSTWATGPSSSSTPAAATPPATWSCGCPTPT